MAHGISDVFVVCAPAALAPGFADCVGPLTDCMRLHRVHWQEARLSDDGKRLVCRFRAPDAESVRTALRGAGVTFDSVWSPARAA